MVMIHSIDRKVLTVVALSLVLVSCNMKEYTLLDKVTSVPKDSEVYKNREKFNSVILNTIDTAVVYEELNIDKNILERLITCNGCHRKYLVYKFYPNGCFNVFSFWKDSSLSVIKFNPDYSGSRGVYYLENNKIRYDYFSAINQQYNMGRITGSLTVVGDTLYIKRDDRKGIDAERYPPHIYIKRKIPAEYFVFKPSW
jgi:hypothetical protein